MTNAPMANGPAARSGFITFAGVMLLLAGSFNLLDGVVALVNDDYYAIDELLFGDLAVWGVWWLFCGALQIVTAIAILKRIAWGVVFGILIAGLNALTQLMFLSAYPAWSIAAIIVDGLIIYALTTRLGEFD